MREPWIHPGPVTGPAGEALGERSAEGSSPWGGPSGALLFYRGSVSLWVLTLVARPLNAARIILVVGLGQGWACCSPSPFTRRIFSQQIPPANVTLVVLSVVVVAITALTLWRRYAPSQAA